ncbi:DUF2057 domain-containing protein [Motilimonas sp. E26]|uniref:DUF2057 domain-containing protein n=1 Tax=Motilimonas sp. E26 TaxID=2865674 RepID=UPI001E5DA0B4|nr:DUF2057 domain-containing protein [Motilimonas sp. E26]MCE0557866.1 DUF2057 domain-containing protein [Motilimonas sp. E26]
MPYIFSYRQALVILFSLLSTACTSSAYQGESRSLNEVAALSLYDSNMHSIDGERVWLKGANFHLLPGERQLAVNLKMTDWDTRYWSTEPLVVYFNAEAGKSYYLEPEIINEMWSAKIYEKGSRIELQYYKHQEQ